MSDTGRGFQIEYPAITLHAVSRGERGPSIYCQLDEHAGEINTAAVGEDEDGDSEMRELTIIPQNPASGMQPSHDLPLIMFSIIILQWNQYSMLSPSVRRSILTKTPDRTMPLTMRLSMPQHSKRLQEMKAKSSVRLGGYAAISSMIVDMRRTRPSLTLLFCLFSWLIHLLSI